MSDDILFDGVRFISAADAAEKDGLTRNYIYQLCKSGWLIFHRVGKHTYIDERSVQRFILQREELQARRKEELSKNRAREYRLSAPASQSGPWSAVSGGIAAVVIAGVVFISAVSNSQFASERGVSLAAAGSTGVFDSISGYIYRTLCPLLRDCYAVSPALVAANPASVRPVSAPPGVVATATTPASKQQITNVYNTYPVAERVVETQKTFVQGGVTPD